MIEKPEPHYANLAEMVNSPEYQEFIKLLRLGMEEGIIEIYPPLPEETK